MIITPAAADRCRTANASSGVGCGRAAGAPGCPAPVSTAAASPANSAERCRASQPITTPASAAAAGARAASRPARRSRPGPRRGSSGSGPAPIVPRRPAVPNSSRPANRSARSAAAARRPRRPGRPRQQILQFGPVRGVRVVGHPGPGQLRRSSSPGSAGQDSSPGQDRPGRSWASSAPIRAAAACPAATTSAWSSPAGGQAGRQVGDQRDRQHLGAEVAGGDRFQGRGHADQVGAEGAEHPDLGRGLVVRAGQRRVDALGQAGVGVAGQRPQPRRVQVGEVGEPGRVSLRRRAGPASGDRPVRLRWSRISTGWPDLEVRPRSRPTRW